MDGATAEGVRCLVVRPPWSWAIRPGGKLIENRAPNAAAWRYRGLVLIQAGHAWSNEGAADPRIEALADVPGLQRGPYRYLLGARTAVPDLFRPGHIVAATNLVDVHAATDGCCEPWGDRHYPADAPEPRPATHLVLDDPHVLDDPVRMPYGLLGLYRPPIDVALAVMIQLLDAAWPGLTYQGGPR